MTPDEELATFAAKYEPEIEAQLHSVLDKMRLRLPGAVEIVYDNYNALVVGFSPTERPSDALFSIAVYPRWISLFFFPGVNLPDPHKLLDGSGTAARHIRLTDSGTLSDPKVQELIAQALALAPKEFDLSQPRRIIIQSISIKQRPRRPLR